jgi:hypothetical protein
MSSAETNVPLTADAYERVEAMTVNDFVDLVAKR